MTQNIDNTYLELIDGPMRARKSTYLTNNLTHDADVGNKVLFIQSEKNNRPYLTHSSDNKKLSPKIDTVSTDILSKVDVGKYDVIGIDEGQFFDDLKDTVLSWLPGKRIYIAGLTSTWQQKDFGQMMELRHYAHKITKMLSTCTDCIRLALEKGHHIPQPNAIATVLVDGAKVNGTVHVGGGETYKSVCFKHLMEHNSRRSTLTPVSINASTILSNHSFR
jgi:thymidine kinase